MAKENKATGIRTKRLKLEVFLNGVKNFDIFKPIEPEEDTLNKLKLPESTKSRNQIIFNVCTYNNIQTNKIPKRGQLRLLRCSSLSKQKYKKKFILPLRIIKPPHKTTESNEDGLLLSRKSLNKSKDYLTIPKSHLFRKKMHESLLKKKRTIEEVILKRQNLSKVEDEIDLQFFRKNLSILKSKCNFFHFSKVDTHHCNFFLKLNELGNKCKKFSSNIY